MIIEVVTKFNNGDTVYYVDEERQVRVAKIIRVSFTQSTVDILNETLERLEEYSILPRYEPFETYFNKRAIVELVKRKEELFYTERQALASLTNP
jgi:hypothetical protein